MRWIFIIGMVSLFGCDSGSKQDSITIATSANMQFAMKAIADKFSENTGLSTNVILGSSGKLTAQIIEGAPYDILVSADMKYPQNVFERGFSKNGPEVYALGQLVMWSVKLDSLPDITEITALDIEHIAIANAVTAPYGRAAIEVLQNIGVYDRVKDKLVFGESIAQANQFITSGAADLGFTAKSVVLSTDLADKGVWNSIESKYYKPIAQGAVIIERDQSNKKDIEAFYKFLFSAEARLILQDFGYLVNE